MPPRQRHLSRPQRTTDTVLFDGWRRSFCSRSSQVATNRVGLWQAMCMPWVWSSLRFVNVTEIYVRKILTLDSGFSSLHIYQAFTGNVPFNEHRQEAMVILDVVSGVQPARPGQEAYSLGLTDDIWALLERCWFTNNKARPGITHVLVRLEAARREFVRHSPANCHGFPHGPIVEVDSPSTGPSSEDEA